MDSSHASILRKPPSDWPYTPIFTCDPPVWPMEMSTRKLGARDDDHRKGKLKQPQMR